MFVKIQVKVLYIINRGIHFQYNHRSSSWKFSKKCHSFFISILLSDCLDFEAPSFKQFFYGDSLLARLNSHYEAWSYKKKMCKKIFKAHTESAQKEPTVKMFLLILDLKPFRSQIEGNHSIGRESHSLAVRGKKLLTQTSL